MTTAYAALDSLADILKNVYGDGLKNQFEDEKLTYNLFPKSDRRPGGNGYVFGIRYARAQGTAGALESGKLPLPFTGQKDQGTITPRYLYGSMRITGPAIEMAKSNTEAFVNSLSDEIDDIYQSIVVDMNRQAHWDGHGQVGRLSHGVSYGGATTWQGSFSNDIGVMYMQEGMLIDVYASNGVSCYTETATHGAVATRILSITPSTRTVTFEAPSATYLANHPFLSAYSNTDTSTLPAGCMVIKSGTRRAAWASTDTSLEITGLKGIYDAASSLATFEGITIASYPKWVGNAMSNSGVNRELSIDLMLNAVDLTRMRSGMSVSKIRMGLGQRRKYANLLLPDVRFAPTVLKGGYETLTFSGGDGSLEIVVDPMNQPNLIYFEPADIIKKYELTPLGWGNLDGSQLHQKAGYDEWDAFLRIYTNLGCEQRNCLTALIDLVEPTVY
jgi:hypothetical protein